MDRKAYQKAKHIERKSTHKKVTVTMTMSEFKEFETIAKKENLTVNKLLFQLANSYKDETYFIPDSLKVELDQLNLLIRNIANNINQIAHSSNIFYEADQQAVLKNLQSLDRLVYDFIKQNAQK